MNCSISTNKDKLDVMAIYEYIHIKSYWGKNRTLEDVQLSIDNSLCFGMYDQNDKQIGFARVVTDFVVFAYLMDVIIFPEVQGKGYGKQLMRFILKHKSLKKVQTFALKTRDAQGLYTPFGFQSVGNSKLWMAMDS
ncbi:GNAT family N-acetyltransferase [Muriicola sp. Z0-33]|uniref:GNAT family N-acetyltransferase n=1 Tax=Muriicola sp. Z0-33 TaxID=2816957 RepID=UPI0022371391|nr:GNAT family N-acetyltransferase [Muriicola sp. Z0-33]MCW5516725.1 GNAT family N-acetyltransferase [Muriicola sp. Z0-33]